MSETEYWKLWKAKRRELVALYRQYRCSGDNLFKEVKETLGDTAWQRPESGRHGDKEGASTQSDVVMTQALTIRSICAQIDAAIAHGDSGNHGICNDQDCRSSGIIEEARLKAIPYAITCVECQERREAEQNEAVPPRRIPFGRRSRRDRSSHQRA